MKEEISYLAYLAGWKIVGWLPEKTAYSLFLRIAHYMYGKNGKSVRRLRRNFSIVRPNLSPEELENLVINGLESYMRYWCDTFRIHTWSSSRIHNTVTTTNDQLLLDPMKNGKGVVVALPHSGNWDHAGAYFCQEGIPLVTVAEILRPKKLFEKFLHYRQQMGFEVLGLDSRAFVTLIKRAREKRLIALVADRDLSSSGVEVRFFGKTAKMPAGPAVLAIKEEIPLVVAHVSYTPEGIHIDFHEVVPPSDGDEEDRIQETVQRIASTFERGITEHLEDWHMLQRIWIDEGTYS
ncbi:MAG: phosphatidylinositol mannoside acyltransferase [Candidatus Planktophila sp.]